MAFFKYAFGESSVTLAQPLRLKSLYFFTRKSLFLSLCQKKNLHRCGWIDPYETNTKFILHNIIFLVIGSLFSGHVLVMIYEQNGNK